jgi:hypothetical protein
MYSAAKVYMISNRRRKMKAMILQGANLSLETIAELIIVLIIVLGPILGLWKIFEKANEPKWQSLIPFLNIYVLLKITNLSGWWMVIFFLGPIGFLGWIYIAIQLADAFGRGNLYGLGLGILPWIFLPILGFGPEEYQGNKISKSLCDTMRKKAQADATINEIAHDLDLDYEVVKRHIDEDCSH